MTRLRRLVPAFSLSLLAAACATGPQWAKPGVSAFTLEQDERQCRRQADQIITQSGGYRYYDAAGAEAGGDPMAAVDRHELGRQLGDEIARCMHAKGYVKAR